MCRLLTILRILTGVTILALGIASFASPQPYLTYLLIFTVGVGIVTYLLKPYFRFFMHGYPIVSFIVLSFGLAFIEEYTAYITNTGIFANPSIGFEKGVGIGVWALFTWSLGAYVIVRRYQFSICSILLIAGLSGWVNEVFVVPRFSENPLMYLLLFPSVVISYTVLLYLPLTVSLHSIIKRTKPTVLSYILLFTIPTLVFWFFTSVLIRL